MEEDRLATINLATDTKTINVPFDSGATAEDLCIKVCKQLGIGPVARHLFALRNHSTRLWYPPGYKFEGKDKIKVDFRLRFKPSTLQRLKHIDIKAYDYYFQQARQDVLNNKVPDIVYERHKRELIGLGVSDMYRVMLEKDVPREIVESDYKKYIPKECIKRHSFFIKKPIHNALGRISAHDASYVKEQYLNQFERMAPNYPYEEYKACMDENIPHRLKVLLRVNAMEIKYCEVDSNEWNTLCLIEDLCSISIRQDSTAEVSRKNGIPSQLKFRTNALLMSFVSALDGYYRLAIKWTFSLCSEIITPSLERLYKLKCHGPVGGEFSYAKLEEKRANKPGTFLLRESETTYNVLYLDVCGKDGKPRTRRIEQVGPNDFILSESDDIFKSLGHLISSFKDPEGQLYLAECVPPSEYDKSPLLICASEGMETDVPADEEIISALLGGEPRCIPPQQLQIYKAQPFPKSAGDPLNRASKTTLYRTMWRVSKGKKLEAAIKVLREEDWKYTKEFLELAGKWSQLKSGALVRLFGLTVAPAVGMLLELVKLGPLDAYLRNNSSQTVKTVDMVEATAYLATALWHLEESGIVHGNIRCRKVLVYLHTENSFVVKLADPGLSNYTQADVHWLPPESYHNLESARTSTQADVWALATTVWQIFSRGAALPAYRDIDTVKKYYSCGKRLPMPNGCPPEVYKLMLECWGKPDIPRKQPQAIVRDISQILYQVYNSRRPHDYASVSPKLFSDSKSIDEKSDIDTCENNSSSDCESRASSLFTDRTSLPWDDLDESGAGLINTAEADEDFSAYLDWLAETGGVQGCRKDEGGRSRGRFISDNSNINGTVCRSIDNDNTGSLSQMQGIYELEADCNVILQGRIGQGFYGEVYRGTLERDNGKDSEPQQVAIKKLKTRASEADLRDFEREITIMKTLKHPNIVEILGVLYDPEVLLVMEFVKHGSLQSYLAIHRETLTHRKLLGFALDVATGMDYLGRKSIVHRDLAARNILVADESRVKISDFGLAQVTGKNDYYIVQTNRDLPIKWYAPESLRDGRFSARTDVWSFGVTMYETFSLGEDPKLPGLGSNQGIDGITNVEEEGSAELLSALERGVRLPCPSKCPQAVYVKLMYPCWNLHSHQRPDFATLCSDVRELISQY